MEGNFSSQKQFCSNDPKLFSGKSVSLRMKAGDFYSFWDELLTFFLVFGQSFSGTQYKIIIETGFFFWNQTLFWKTDIITYAKHFEDEHIVL